MQRALNSGLITFFLFLAIVLVLFAINNNILYAYDLGSLIYLPSEDSNDVKIRHLITKYWDWAINVPGKNNIPEVSPFPIGICDIKDMGDVVFLVDPLKVPVSTSYTCTLSEGKALFFPLINSEYDVGLNDFEKASDNQLLENAKKDNERGTRTLKIDNTEISSNDIDKLHITSDFWNIETNYTNNQYGAKIGHWRAVVDGTFVYLKPLSPGHHEIQYSAAGVNAFNVPNPEVEITYKIDVVSVK